MEVVMTYKEKLLLSLYLEMFDKYYDVSDKRIDKGVFLRHTEMQNLSFLVQNLGIKQLHYSFVFDSVGPISPTLQAHLLETDAKEESIFDYYKSYTVMRNDWYSDYQSQLNYILSKFLSSDQIYSILHARYALKGVLEKDGGSQALADLVYVTKYVLPNRTFPVVTNYLESQGYCFDLNLLEEIWHSMALLGLRPIASVSKDFNLTRKK